jgi:hypothetical protein
MCPNSLLFMLFHFGTHLWVFWRVCGHVIHLQLQNVECQFVIISKIIIKVLYWVNIYLRPKVGLWSHLSKVPSKNPCFGNFVVFFNTLNWFQSFNQDIFYSFMTCVEATCVAFQWIFSTPSSYCIGPKSISRT